MAFVAVVVVVDDAVLVNLSWLSLRPLGHHPHLHHHRCSYHRYSCTITTDAYMCDDEEEEEEEEDDDDDDVGGNDHHDGVIANCDGDGDNLAMSMMS